MLRRTVWPVVLTALLLGLLPARAEPLVRRVTSIRAFEMNAVVVDRKGIRTELTGFTRLFGTGALAAHLGDAEVSIPFERIRSFQVGILKDTRAPVEVQLADGHSLDVEIDPQEYSSTFTAHASFGSFRIMLGKIARCELSPMPPEPPPPPVKACDRGHRWSQEDYSYCPYDGHPLEPIVRKSREELEEGE